MISSILLPYTYDALEPYYDEETLKLHYDIDAFWNIVNWDVVNKRFHSIT